MAWAVEAVGDYVENVRPRFGCEGHPALWVTERGGRVRPAEINARFVAYRDALGLPQALVPHSIRPSADFFVLWIGIAAALAASREPMFPRVFGAYAAHQPTRPAATETELADAVEDLLTRAGPCCMLRLLPSLEAASANVRDRIDAADRAIMARLSAENSPVLDRFLPALSRSRDNRTPPPLLRPGVGFACNGDVFTGASGVAVTRYRYRGGTIPTPWTPNQQPPPAELTSGQDTPSARCGERRTPGGEVHLRETDQWQHQNRARQCASPRGCGGLAQVRPPSHPGPAPVGSV